jgi:hypothetical protein
MPKRRKKLRGAAKAAFLRRMAAGRRAKASKHSGRRARKRTRRASPSTRRVHHRRSPIVAAKRKRRATSGKRRRRRAHVARRRTHRRRTHRRRSTVTFRRVTGKVYRTNAGFGGLTGKLMRGAKNAAVVTLSRAGINIVSRLLPLGQSVPMRAVAQIAATGAVGWAADRFLGKDFGDLAIIGGFDALYTSFIRNFNVPVLSSALGDDVIQGYYLGDGMGAYYDAGRSTLPAAAVPAMHGYDDSEAALISQ